MRTRNVAFRVGALGDLVMSLLAARALREFAIETTFYVGELGKKLIDGRTDFEVRTYAPPQDRDLVVVEDYLNQLPHRDLLPKMYRHADDMPRHSFGHLASWIGRHVTKKLSLEGPLVVNPKDIALWLDEKKLKTAREMWDEYGLPEDRSKAVLFHAEAGSCSRKAEISVLEQAAVRLEAKGYMVFFLKSFPGAPSVNSPWLAEVECPIELLPEFLAVGPRFVAPDTGPTHIAAAAKTSIGRPGDEVVWLLGSSNEHALLYKDNIAVVSHTQCPMRGSGRGCGWHGYAEVKDRDSLFQICGSNPNDLCIYESFAENRIAPCMAEIRPQQVVDAVVPHSVLV